jgi:hypothetical protein
MRDTPPGRATSRWRDVTSLYTTAYGCDNDVKTVIRSYELCGLFHVDDFVKGDYSPGYEQSYDYQTYPDVEGRAER